MLIRCLVPAIIAALTVAGSAADAFAQDDYAFHKVVGEWDVSARQASPPIDASDVTVADAQGRGRTLDKSLGGTIEDAFAFETDRLILVLNGNRMAIVDPGEGTVADEFYAGNAALSPTHRFIAFTAIVPRWAEASALYLVYDVSLSPEQNCMNGACGSFECGWAVYPDRNRRGHTYDRPQFDATHEDAPRPPASVRSAMHELRSDLTWMSESTFAFLDYSQKQSQVVFVDLAGGAAKARIASGTLNVPAIVDVTKLPDNARPIDAGRWLLGESLQRQTLAAAGLGLRVWLQWHPWMKVDHVDVPLRFSAR